MDDVNLTLDHKPLSGAEATRRYFAKFERIIGHMEQVAETSRNEGLLDRAETDIVLGYLQSLSGTFTALANKYLMAGRVSNRLPHSLTIDRQDSGFPIYQELMQMANDALQVEKHLQNLPSPTKLKQEMVQHILNEHTIPTGLQYAMSQRLYYEYLAAGQMFWAQTDPQAQWLGDIDKRRRRYLVHWASYDSQVNIPTIYVMLVEDSGRTALPRDQRRWPRAQNHLMAQSLASLKLVTIAQGFDQDFDDLHPKYLRRFHIGPMYSHTFTQQTGPLREVLAEADGSPGEDWALAWTVETLVSESVTEEKSGFFGSVEREVFKLDHFGKTEKETGSSQVRRSIILPAKPHQVLEERQPPGMNGVRKYVVGPKGQLLSYR